MLFYRKSSHVGIYIAKCAKMKYYLKQSDVTLAEFYRCPDIVTGWLVMGVWYLS